jgi:hypothetical protein
MSLLTLIGTELATTVGIAGAKFVWSNVKRKRKSNRNEHVGLSAGEFISKKRLSSGGYVSDHDDPKYLADRMKDAKVPTVSVTSTHKIRDLADTCALLIPELGYIGADLVVSYNISEQLYYVRNKKTGNTCSLSSELVEDYSGTSYANEIASKRPQLPTRPERPEGRYI